MDSKAFAIALHVNTGKMSRRQAIEQLAVLFNDDADRRTLARVIDDLLPKTEGISKVLKKTKATKKQ